MADLRTTNEITPRTDTNKVLSKYFRELADRIDKNQIKDFEIKNAGEFYMNQIFQSNMLEGKGCVTSGKGFTETGKGCVTSGKGNLETVKEEKDENDSTINFDDSEFMKFLSLGYYVYKMILNT